MAQAGEIPVYGKLVSETTSHVLAGANQIKDETANKMQSQINSEVQTALAGKAASSHTHSAQDITDLPDIPDAQIQSDWNQSDNTKKDFIKNKPTIPAAQVQSDWNQSDNSKVDYIKNKPTIPTVNNATLTIQKNGVKVDDFTANAATDKVINILVPTSASDVNALPSSTKYAASLSLSIDPSTFVVTAQLKDQDGSNLGSAATIDLPLESVVVNGSYDSTSKKIVLTLQSGSVINIPVGDLIAGLQSEITSSNKLSCDLLSDGDTNKVFTATLKTKLEGIETGAQKNVQSDWNQSSSSADDFIKNKPTIPSKTSDLTNDSGFITSHQDITGKADKVSGATSGNFAGLDGNGNLTDSGKSASDFAPASGSANYAAASHTHSISDVSGLQTEIDKLKRQIKAAL